jgi:hypothetical protein
MTRITREASAASACQKPSGTGARRSTRCASRRTSAYSTGVSTRLSGMPMTATAPTHTADKRHVARLCRRWASKKLSRSTGPGTGERGDPPCEMGSRGSIRHTFAEHSTPAAS